MFPMTYAKHCKIDDDALPDWLTGLPARKINYRAGSGIKTFFSASKPGVTAETESLLEAGYLELLEWDSLVRTYFVQPVTMELIVGGRPVKYTPDVFVVYHSWAKHQLPDARNTIVEVKPWHVLKRDWAMYRPKFEAARAWCKAKNLRFHIATDRAIRPIRVENIRTILNYRGERYLNLQKHEYEMRRLLERTAHDVGMSTPMELLNMITSLLERKIEFIPLLWNLVATGTLSVDMDSKLTMSSPIWPTRPRVRSLRSH